LALAHTAIEARLTPVWGCWTMSVLCIPSNLGTVEPPPVHDIGSSQSLLNQKLTSTSTRSTRTLWIYCAGYERQARVIGDGRLMEVLISELMERKARPSQDNKFPCKITD
jgi:hypothetical protein